MVKGLTWKTAWGYYDYNEKFLPAPLTARDFQVCVADTRQRHAHQRFAIYNRLCYVGDVERSVFVAESFHKLRTQSSEIRGQNVRLAGFFQEARERG